MQNYQGMGRNSPGSNAAMGPGVPDSMNYGDARGGGDHPRGSYNNGGRGDVNALQNVLLNMRNAGFNMNPNSYSGGGASGNGSFGNPLSNNMGGNGGGGGMMGNNSGGGGGSGAMNRSDNMSGPYQRGNRGNYGNNQQGGSQHGNSNAGWGSNQNRNLDMPNLQTLGINSQGPKNSQSAQNMNNALGVGLNLNSMPMNPAIVAAALSQWSMLGNQLQNQDQVMYNSNSRSNNREPEIAKIAD